jgi:hypothetical protein
MPTSTRLHIRVYIYRHLRLPARRPSHQYHVALTVYPFQAREVLQEESNVQPVV